MVMGHDRHGSQRILEVLATITANFVAVSFDGEDAAQLRMMTTKSKIQSARERMRNRVPKRSSFMPHDLHLQFKPLSSLYRQFEEGRERRHAES